MFAFPDTPLSDAPEYSSIVLSTLQSDKPVEERTSVPDSIPSDPPPSGEPPEFHIQYLLIFL